MVTNYICPVCGFPDLYEPAYDVDLGSLEICPSCGFQFGKTDDDEHITHEEWRRNWVTRGMLWRGRGRHAPLDWNPKKQLLNVGVVL